MEENNYDLELDKLMKVRKEKLENMIEKGKNPFEVTKYDRTHMIKDIKDNFENYD